MSRLALAIGGIPFTDDRVKGEDWPSRKSSTPYGSMPVLTIDGVQHAQSVAIARYCATLSGLYPSDPLLALKVDEILDTVIDTSASAGRARGMEEDKMKAERKRFLDEDVPRYVGGLEKRLELFGDGPWVVGHEITIADLAVYSIVAIVKSGTMDHVPVHSMDKYTRVMKCYNAVKEHPKVVEWYKKCAEHQK